MARISLAIALALLISAVALPTRAGVESTAADDAGAEFFERQIRPVLATHCFECHGAAKVKGGLRLDSRAGLLKGGDSGPAAVAGKPEESLLVAAVSYVDEPKMPPKKKLSDAEISALTRWVALGLPWPDQGAAQRPSTTGPGAGFRVTEEQRRFWAFQPVAPVAPPPVKDQAWPSSSIDRFILAALEAKGLRPAPPADRRTLIRRATFDLTGLPPSPEEVDAFVADSRPDAFARVVDRLLASEAYGERWGRHWLDVVRYADSFDARGTGSDGDIAHAWRYRDWVVRAFNRDLPYDRFIRDQIAGDVLAADDPDGFDADRVVATGMLAIGNWGGGDADKEKLLTDIADDQVDVVSRSFLGLTVACARCHDHKFDPISTKDYYGLAGIFFSTHILPDVGPKTNGPPMLKIPLVSARELARREQNARRTAQVERTLAAKLEEKKARFARALQPETARCIVAACDYASQADGPGRPLAEFAASRGLHEFALRRWIRDLGLLGDAPLMERPVAKVLGNPRVSAWRGEPDTPSLLINDADAEVALLTFKIPPRSVTVHPGPKSGVAVAWTSPISGVVRIAGRLADADPVAGDGIAWTLEHRRGLTSKPLGSGEIANGGSQPLSGDGPVALAVRAGDRLRLVVLPKGSHVCDTTVVDWTIEAADGTGRWSLAGDVVGDPLQGNPHRDRLGHDAVWRFEDAGEPPPAVRREGAPDGPRERLARALAANPIDRSAIEAAARAIQEAGGPIDKRCPFWIDSEADETALPEADRVDLASLRAELAALKRDLPPPPSFANGAQEGGVPGSPHQGVHDVRVHIRGSYARLGDLVPRHFPVILAGDTLPKIPSGSGRRELGDWLTRPDHPLTARVMVNRIWQGHFGAGIVRTPSNFGKLGERPTHPELLDELASAFVKDGWSVKAMHRRIMLSSVYRQASEAMPETAAADPDNRLFGRMNRRRLEAEAIRDSLLAVAGRLDRTVGGPGFRALTDPRRTLYLMTVRSDRATFGSLFDAADPTAMVDQRVVSTVAPQALFLLNNPFVLDLAGALARRVLSERAGDAERIDRVYTIVYGRPPAEQERAIGLEALGRAAAPAEAWTAYCQVLLCANEFLYVD